VKEKKKAVDKEVAWKGVSIEKRKSLRTGEVHGVEMIEKRTRVDQDIKGKMPIEEKKMRKEDPEDGETAKNVKWINGDHLEIEMNVVEETVIWIVVALLGVQLMKENGDGKIEKMTGIQVQEEKRIEMEIDAEIGVDVDSMIVILKEGHQDELEVKIVGEDPKERNGALLEETEMGQLGVEGMIVAHEMIEVLEEEMTVDIVEGMIVAPVEEMTGAEETIVARLIGDQVLENLTETIKPQGIANVVMIGVIEAKEVVEVTIGGRDQEWVTEIVEVRVIVALPPKTNPLVVKTRQMERKENGKLSANVNLRMLFLHSFFVNYNNFIYISLEVL